MKMEAVTQMGAAIAHHMLTYSGRTWRTLTVMSVLKVRAMKIR